MVRVNVSRVGIEVLADTIPQANTTKQGFEVATTSGSGAARVDVSRVGIEVLRKTTPKMRTTKQGFEAATESGVGATRVNVSRVGIEVIASLRKKAKTTKQGFEAAITSRAGAARVDVSRVGIELLARSRNILVTPRPLVSGLDLFLHNWAAQVSIESSYTTDVAISPTTGAESRRGLVLKPARTMSLLWTRSSAQDLDRLAVHLRRLTETRIQIPLYCDQTTVTTGALAGQPVLSLNSSRARLFPGARVAVVHLDHAYQVSSYEIYQILERSASQLTFTTNITVDIEAGAIVFPLMDCDMVLNPTMSRTHGRLAGVALSLPEAGGGSALPPIQSDIPDTFGSYQGLPIFDIEPDWNQAVSTGYDRQGERYQRGLQSNTYVTAGRARWVEEYQVTGDRDLAWRTIGFFDSRRGRLRSYFHIDHEELWTVQSASGVFIEVDKLGNFDDFLVGLNPGYVGLKMTDGTAIVRQVVTVQDLASSWRITVADALPSISVANIERFARARKVRQVSDAMTERWVNTNYFSTSWNLLETLDEGEHTL